MSHVDWGAAVRQLHDMETDEIPLDPRVLVEFARASCRRVREELHEMYPGERFLDEPYPDDDIFDDVGEVHPDELDAVPPGAPRSRHAQQF
jgi:aminoglycoside phosphotransferase